MDDDAREGPVERQVIACFCTGCKRHTQELIKSGRHPTYYHYCQHPQAWTALDGLIIDDSPRGGRFIGETKRTPTWCPVLAEREVDDV